MTVYIVQWEDCRIPYDPRVYTNRKAAEAYYIRAVNGITDGKAKDVSEADALIENWDGSSRIRYWSVRVRGKRQPSTVGPTDGQRRAL